MARVSRDEQYRRVQIANTAEYVKQRASGSTASARAAMARSDAMEAVIAAAQVYAARLLTSGQSHEEWITCVAEDIRAKHGDAVRSMQTARAIARVAINEMGSDASEGNTQMSTSTVQTSSSKRVSKAVAVPAAESSANIAVQYASLRNSGKTDTEARAAMMAANKAAGMSVKESAALVNAAASAYVPAVPAVKTSSKRAAAAAAVPAVPAVTSTSTDEWNSVTADSYIPFGKGTAVIRNATNHRGTVIGIKTHNGKRLVNCRFASGTMALAPFALTLASDAAAAVPAVPAVASKTSTSSKTSSKTAAGNKTAKNAANVPAARDIAAADETRIKGQIVKKNSAAALRLAAEVKAETAAAAKQARKTNSAARGTRELRLDGPKYVLLQNASAGIDSKALAAAMNESLSGRPWRKTLFLALQNGTLVKHEHAGNVFYGSTITAAAAAARAFVPAASAGKTSAKQTSGKTSGKTAAAVPAVAMSAAEKRAATLAAKRAAAAAAAKAEAAAARKQARADERAAAAAAAAAAEKRAASAAKRAATLATKRAAAGK